MKRLFPFCLVVLLGLAFVGSVTPSWSAGTLKVTAPNAGEEWVTGKKYAITWTKGSAGKYVRIQLLRSGKVYKWITKKTKNDGRFTWKVPTKTKAGSKYRVRVQSLTKPKLHDVSDLFLVTGKGKKTSAAKAAVTTLKVKSPNGDELLIKGKVVVIKWTKGNGGKFIKILLLKSNKPYKWVSKKTRNDGKHPWKVPKGLAISSEYKIKLIALKNKKVFDLSDDTFSIDTETDDSSVGDGTWIAAPEDFSDIVKKITVTSPKGGENWKGGTSYDITWESNAGSIVRIDLYNQRWKDITISSETSDDGSFTWRVPDNHSGSGNYRILVQSQIDQTVFDFSAYFGINHN